MAGYFQPFAKHDHFLFMLNVNQQHTYMQPLSLHTCTLCKISCFNTSKCNLGCFESSKEPQTQMQESLHINEVLL